MYTLVNTDYHGNKLLPHFLNYYHGQGITWRRFLVLLHHTPGRYSRKGLEDAMGICSGYAVECRWAGGGVCGGRVGGGSGQVPGVSMGRRERCSCSRPCMHRAAAPAKGAACRRRQACPPARPACLQGVGGAVLV